MFGILTLASIARVETRLRVEMKFVLHPQGIARTILSLSVQESSLPAFSESQLTPIIRPNWLALNSVKEDGYWILIHSGLSENVITLLAQAGLAIFG